MQAEDGVVEFRRERGDDRGTGELRRGLLEVHERPYRALYFITGSQDDAEELMQDAFLKLWERRDSIGVVEDPVAWVFRVSLNESCARATTA